MNEFVHQWQHQGRTITFSWAGTADVTPSRVYALAFTPERKMLLVGAEDNPDLWLPGGGIEDGESAEEALIRELAEEAAASVHALARIGAQRVEDPASGVEYQDFYWCRVTLAAEFTPAHEVAFRHLVAPEEFLDTLFWGRHDPKAGLLLATALDLEQRYG